MTDHKPHDFERDPAQAGRDDAREAMAKATAADMSRRPVLRDSLNADPCAARKDSLHVQEGEARELAEALLRGRPFPMPLIHVLTPEIADALRGLMLISISNAKRAADFIASAEPQFDAEAPEQERLAIEFCREIAGPRGMPGCNPDPVRLLEMSQALYRAEMDYRRGAFFVECAADHIADVSKMVAEGEAHKLLATVYVLGWGQYIGSDGATAIQNVLAREGLRIVMAEE